MAEPAAVSVTVTVTEVQPVALTVNVAAPVPELLAVMYTGCGRFQLLDDSVTGDPLATDRPVFPDVWATLTAMPADGDALSETPSTPVCPWASDIVPGFAWSVIPEPQDPPVLPATSVAVTVAAV